MIFNVKNGDILSARTYTAGVYRNFNYQIRSLIVSSGPLPMAYVLSNYRTSNAGSSCSA